MEIGEMIQTDLKRIADKATVVYADLESEYIEEVKAMEERGFKNAQVNALNRLKLKYKSAMKRIHMTFRLYPLSIGDVREVESKKEPGRMMKVRDLEGLFVLTADGEKQATVSTMTLWEEATLKANNLTELNPYVFGGIYDQGRDKISIGLDNEFEPETDEEWQDYKPFMADAVSNMGQKLSDVPGMENNQNILTGGQIMDAYGGISQKTGNPYSGLVMTDVGSDPTQLELPYGDVLSQEQIEEYKNEMPEVLVWGFVKFSDYHNENVVKAKNIIFM